MDKSLSKLIFLVAILFTAPTFSLQTNWNIDIDAVRSLSQRTPGALPVRLNIIKIGESHRTKDVVLKGEPAIPHTMVRTAYQVMYKNGFIMIDSGMSFEIHQTFGANDPYFADNNQKLQQALLLANLIVVTHEHADHISGVVSTPNFNKLAPKTLLLKSQADSLVQSPQRPQLKLNPSQVRQYVLFDYEKYFPLAPGLVLIKAPGHTKGSQFVYLKLQNGKEFLLVGDVSWHTQGIKKLKLKNASWVKEDNKLIMAELRALNMLSKKNQINILVSHDNDQYEEFAKWGMSANKLELA